MSINNMVALAVPNAAELERELSRERFVRSFRDLDIYLVTAMNAPTVMDRIGQIREVEFRAEGGGTGKPVDIDKFDRDPGCGQLVAWDPVEGDIVSMYRFLRGDRSSSTNGYNLPTARLFDFSEEFKTEYLPVTIELGRSVVNRSAKKKMHGLHAIWSGLGALICELPHMRFFFGKITTYNTLGKQARALLFELMDAYFRDSEHLVYPKDHLCEPHRSPSSPHCNLFTGTDYKRDFAKLRNVFSELGETIPPLFISYAGLSSTMKVFGTARNPHFGDVTETAILVRIADIRDKYVRTFVEGYRSVNPSIFETPAI